MVKFTFASIFLTLASLFALVSAVPAAPSYSISSVQTNGVIFSDGTEKVGDRVFTVPPSQANSDNSLLIIDGGPGAALPTVQGKAGLYISGFSYPNSPYLRWASGPYKWTFSLHPSGNYFITLPTGEDGYWFSDSSIGASLIIKSGADVTLNQVSFTITANTSQ